MQRVVLALGFAGAIACGGGQATPNNPSEVTTTDKGETLASAEGTANLTPVAAPNELVAVARLKNPGGLVDSVISWAKLGVDWRGVLGKKEPAINDVLATDASVEAVVALDPQGKGTDLEQPFAVVSVGLRSLERAVQLARDKGERVRQIGNGIYRVSDSSRSPNCVVAASLGKAPARLVCGDREKDIEALLPYATRGLPTENLGSADLHIEVRAEPFRRRFARELRQGKTLATPFVLSELSLDDSRFDRALADTVHAVADEVLALAEDIDSSNVGCEVGGSGWPRKEQAGLQI